MLKNDPVCEEYDIKVEHYIVSTGFAEVIRGTELMDYVENIWGCELIEDDELRRVDFHKEFAENIKKQEQSKRSGNYSISTHLV